MSAINELVFGQSRPEKKIGDLRELSESWIASYRIALLECINQAKEKGSWKKNDFKAAHWVSKYLPIRYKAYNQLGDSSD